MTPRDRLTIVSVFPQLLGTYGDAGNECALAHRLSSRGLATRRVSVRPGEPIPDDADFYLLGGAEDGAQALAVGLIGDSLRRAIERGAAVLGVCAGMQILGESFTVASGETHQGLGLLDITTMPGSRRAVGEVIVDSHVTAAPLVGFENHRGVTRIGSSAMALGSVRAGVGNGDGRATEGALQGRVFGTYLHGPVLALNPEFADHFAATVVGDLAPLADEWVGAVRAIRLAMR